MATILMMSAKMDTPGLLKINVFWSKGYDVIIYAHDAANKLVPRDSNYFIRIWPGKSLFWGQKAPHPE